jgi:hypothetical protein
MNLNTVFKGNIWKNKICWLDKWEYENYQPEQGDTLKWWSAILNVYFPYLFNFLFHGCGKTGFVGTVAICEPNLPAPDDGRYGALMENSNCQQKPDVLYLKNNLLQVLLFLPKRMFSGFYTGLCSKRPAGNYLKCSIAYLIFTTIIQY